MTKAEALVSEMQAAEKVSKVKDAAELASAKAVYADEAALYKSDAAEAKQHVARLAELTLGTLAFLSGLLAYWLTGERMKLLGFAAACLGGIAAVMFVEAILPYVVYMVWLAVLIGGAYLARKHLTLSALTADLAYLHPAAGFKYLEGEARALWAWIVSEVHSPKIAAALSGASLAADFKAAETEVSALVAKAKGVLSTSHATVTAPPIPINTVSGGSADVVKFGADPTGISDSSAAFTAAAAAIQPAGGKLVAANGGTFKVSLAAYAALPANVQVYGVSITH